MLGTATESWTPPLDSSRNAMEFVHHLLCLPPEEHTNLDGLLENLTAAFAAVRAGLATYPEGKPLSVHPQPVESGTEVFLPWPEQPEWIERLQRARVAMTVPRKMGGSCLLTVIGVPSRGCWLLWLERAERTPWSTSEAVALGLVGQALMHVFMRDETQLPWALQLDRSIRRQRMDASARIVRRLAHDFGNILTGILGFSELALSPPVAPSSSLHTYLTEIHRGAQNGAQYTNQLRLFARRQTTSNRAGNLAEVLAEEEKRLQPLLGANVQLKLNLPDDLPAVAMEPEPLRQALAIVLENAREAITGTGTIDVLVQSVQVSAGEALEIFGEVRPGPHLEIRVADSGNGLTPEAQRQLFSDPFFSTKSRKRGFGLAMAYGILSSHRGGLELLPRPEGGTIARLLVPAAELAEATTAHESTSGQARSVGDDRACEGAPSRERVLIVDDDPMMLHVTATTLERAGFRIQTAANAEQALQSYSSAADPFHLVLSDVLMPEINGIELARRLIAQDANVSILFMSGEVPAEIMQQCFGRGRFELLAKPFRPDGLVRAVRAAIDRAGGERAAVSETIR